MAKRKLLIELSPEAVSIVEDLMKVYGETSHEGMISRALGFLQMAVPYLDEEGALTVFDPEAEGEKDLVALVFTNAPRSAVPAETAH